ncbi:MAG: hypothetical protein KME40_06130 [Komarekiella atlantica HA4396-MV6]|nr:hypothetical protein [Komarekiella atlantica HA4396-MV6]
MSNIGLWESAKQGNINAISDLVQKAFDDDNVTVEPHMDLLGITLTLKLSSQKVLEPQVCIKKVIETLNEIQPTGIKLVRVSSIASICQIKYRWNRWIDRKQGEFVDDTKNANLLNYITIAFLVSWIGCTTFTNKPSSPPPNTSSQTSTQITNPDCLYVPESAIAGKNWQEISQFKDELKRQSGKKCVLFTGG